MMHSQYGVDPTVHALKTTCPNSDVITMPPLTEPTKNQSRVLVVDDDIHTRMLFEILLQRDGLETALADDGQRALELAQTFKPHLILLDLMMPGMSGYEVVKKLKLNPETRSIPVILVSALEDRESRLQGLQAGAEEFITKPIDHLDLKIRVRNLLRLKEFNDFLEKHNQILESRVTERTRALHESFVESINTLMRAAEFRDDETGDHVNRISHYSLELAHHMGMDKEFCDLIFYASPMHDIGKIGIPDAILLKPASFTPNEWSIMQQHTTIGAKILANNSSPYLRMGHDIALSHHERWDGSGYPEKLAGEAIPLPARIMQLVDVYDALRSHRPYKSAYDHTTALDIIVNGDGRTLPSHFDPAVLMVFQKRAHAMQDIFDSLNHHQPVSAQRTSTTPRRSALISNVAQKPEH